MKTLLVPVDFSIASEKGLNYALELAREYKSKVILVNIWNLPQAHSSMLISLSDIIKKNAEKAMVDLKKKLIDDPANKDISFEGKVRMGEVSQLITSISENNQVDLIVMGTGGAEGFFEVFAGTNAGDILEDAPCPVIIVPEKGVVSVPKRIAFATNFAEGDIARLKQLISWFKGFNAEFYLIHIGEEEQKDLNEFENFVLRAKKVVPELKKCDYLKGEDVLLEIQEYIEKVGINLLAMAIRKHGFFELLLNKSLTIKMSYSSTIPIMALKETVEAPPEEKVTFSINTN
jgi:nucleotide-binding universal stress UspA family protein